MKPKASAGENSNSSAMSVESEAPAKPGLIGRSSRLWVGLCVKRGRGDGSLTLRKAYRILPDRRAARDGYLRVVDDSGEDYLYRKDYFVLARLSPEFADPLLQGSPPRRAKPG
jgi:hypothetical protein